MSRLKSLWTWLLTHGSKRTLLMVVATTVAISGAASGTLAWLMDQTPEVTNTFTYGDIQISLTETDTQLDDDDDPTTNEYRMMPGASISKDPKVTVQADSEDCWLYVQLEKTSHFDQFLTYQMADGWMPLTDGVYYRSVDHTDADQVFSVLANDQIQVLTSVTKEMLHQLDANGTSNYPQLTITAYAIQRDASIAGVDEASAAWTLIQNQQN